MNKKCFTSQFLYPSQCSTPQHPKCAIYHQVDFAVGSFFSSDKQCNLLMFTHQCLSVIPQELIQTSSPSMTSVSSSVNPSGIVVPAGGLQQGNVSMTTINSQVVSGKHVLTHTLTHSLSQTNTKTRCHIDFFCLLLFSLAQPVLLLTKQQTH